MSTKYTVSLRLNEKENSLIRNFAEIKGISVSEFLREAALNEIRKELDVLTFEEAYENHLKEKDILSSEKLRKLMNI